MPTMKINAPRRPSESQPIWVNSTANPNIAAMRMLMPSVIQSVLRLTRSTACSTQRIVENITVNMLNRKTAITAGTISSGAPITSWNT
jgi:hypothetical protein